MTNKELEKKVDNLTDRFEALISSLTYGGKSISKLLPHKENPIVEKEQPKEEFEVGGWYKGLESDEDYKKTFVCYSDGACYGFSTSGNWTTTFNNSGDFFIKNRCRKATTQEIETALIKEAKKRGFKEGVEIKSLLSGSVCRARSGEFGYNEDYNTLSFFCTWIFKDGEWSDVVENSFEIAGHKVEIDGGGKIVIGCQVFLKESLEKLYEACVECNITYIAHGCHRFETENLKKIIDYINK